MDATAPSIGPGMPAHAATVRSRICSKPQTSLHPRTIHATDRLQTYVRGLRLCVSAASLCLCAVTRV